MKVEVFKDEYAEWDAYVKANDDGTFFHQIGWKQVIERTFGHRPHYLYAEKDGRICGILPMFTVRSILFGKLLISSPYAVYGGPCAEDRETETLLLDEAFKVARKENVKYLELRNIDNCSYDLPQTDLYVTFRHELPASKEECLKNIPKSARNSAKRALRHGMELETGLNKLETLYRLFAAAMRNLGSPVYPISLMKNIADVFSDQVKIFIVKFENKAVAGGMVYAFKDKPIGSYAGSLKEYNQYRVNSFLYLKIMEYFAEQGCRCFDFSRSRIGSGAYSFKKNWGAQPQPLRYQYYLNRSKEIPQPNPSNPKFSLPKKIWQNLPLPVTVWLGGKITKHIP
ncbi:FemAB family XrtA/PEP-CTERM system-associated protein [Acidobacteriota bacterium]